MEKGCILPNNELTEISREGNVVLESLSRFCNCSKKELLKVLQERNLPLSDIAFEGNVFGYKRYQKKINNKIRMLREPTPTLKKIQKMIKERLLCIPVSLCSTAGKNGDSAEKNAEIHRYNPYLITLDIKNAYPSIDTKRVYKYLEGALFGKPLDIWAPLLETPENQKLFIRALTHLCVSENQLPQGAPTSNQIQNIVMKGFDTKIEKRLPELSTSDIFYSRYADDLTISFRQYHTKDVLQEKFWEYESILMGKNREKIKNLIEKFPSEVFNATDNFERKYISEKIEELKNIIKNSSFIYDKEKYQYIGILNTYKQKIRKANRRIDNITDEIIKIIGNEGRTINSKKIQTRTPQSNTPREINKICFDENGKRSLNRKKQSEYKRLFEDLLEKTTEELYANRYYFKKFKMNEHNEKICYASIMAALKGVYNRIKKIYGAENIPSEFTKIYTQAIKKRENYPARKEAEQEEIEKRKQKKLKKEEEKRKAETEKYRGTGKSREETVEENLKRLRENQNIKVEKEEEQNSFYEDDDDLPF